MLNRHNRLLVTLHILSDATLAAIAFVGAYALRFHFGIIPALIPITRGVPPVTNSPYQVVISAAG